MASSSTGAQQADWKQQLDRQDRAARIGGPLIFAFWLLTLWVYPSIPLAFVALAWVVYFRTNRVRAHIDRKQAHFHAESLAALALLANRESADDPAVQELLETIRANYEVTFPEAVRSDGAVSAA